MTRRVYQLKSRSGQILVTVNCLEDASKLEQYCAITAGSISVYIHATNEEINNVN